MKINYSGLVRATKRDRKYNKRRYGMKVSGKSVFVLDRVIKERAKRNGNLERVPADLQPLPETSDSR
jgi:hypothetical protein